MSKSSKSILVPSNDNVAFANVIVQSLDALSVRRQAWESEDYKKANEGLYALLADCLDVFENKFVKADDNSRKTLRSELRARLIADGIKVQANSTTLTMLVRFVFGSDRKRAHGYAYVLMAALTHNVAAIGLPAWIVEQGGIEEIKRRMVKSAEAVARARQVEAARATVIAELEDAAIKPLAKVSLALSGNYAVLLAKPQLDGTTSIIGALPEINEALFNALLVRMARRRAASDAERKQLSKEADDMLAVNKAAALAEAA